MKDLYLILGLTRSATQSEIKTAYRDKIKFFHPDHWHDDPVMAQTALERTRDLNEAYAVLGDPTLRAKYDRGLIQPGASRPPSAPRRQPAYAAQKPATPRPSMSDYLRRYPNLRRALFILVLVPAAIATVVVLILLTTVIVDQSIAPTATATPTHPANLAAPAVSGLGG